MNRKYDKNDVLKFLYGELPDEEIESFTQALCTDDDLLSYYESLQDTCNRLDRYKDELSPSLACLDKILAYAETSSQPSPEGNFNTSKPKRNLLQPILTASMVVFTGITIGFAMYSISKTPAAYAEATQSTSTKPVFNWQSPSIERKLLLTRYRMQNLSRKEEILPVIQHRNFSVVKTSGF